MSIGTNFITLSLTGFLFGFVLLLCSISSGEAVNCYQCSSVNTTDCEDPFDKKEELLVNCSIEYPQAKFCRKIDQTVRGKQRIFRRCAWEEHKNKDCYYGANEYYKAKICICHEDGCNGANHLQLIPSFVVLLLTASVFFVQ